MSSQPRWPRRRRRPLPPAGRPRARTPLPSAGRRGRDPGRQHRAVRRGRQRARRGPGGQPADDPVLAQVADDGRRGLRQRGLHPRQPAVRALPDPGRLHGAVRRDVGRRRPRSSRGCRSAGFSGVSADSGRDYVRPPRRCPRSTRRCGPGSGTTGPPPGVNAGRYRLRANDRPVSLPPSVAAQRPRGHRPGERRAGHDLRHARRPRSRPAASAAKPISFPCSSWYAQHYAHRLPRQYGTTSFPTIVCGYSADQLRAAYGYNRHNIGKGVTIALVEIGLTPDMFQTLRDYAGSTGIESPSASRYAELSLGRGSACGDEFNVEEQLDVESSYDMAPLANQLVIGGDSCNDGFYGLQALFDADTAILNGAGGHPLARIASNSWEGNDESQPAQPGQHRARVPAAGRRRGRQHAVLGRRRLRCAYPVERPVRHRGRRHARSASAGTTRGCSRPAGPPACRSTSAIGGSRRARRTPAAAARACSGRSPDTSAAWCRTRWPRRPATGPGWSARCPTSAPTPTRRPAWASGC